MTTQASDTAEPSPAEQPPAKPTAAERRTADEAEALAAVSAACEAFRAARQIVRAQVDTAARRSQIDRDNATRRDWSSACASALALELERPDVDEAVVAVLRGAMFSTFPI